MRGPQSALWGSEAIGGVIAVERRAPASEPSGSRSEAGSLRLSARVRVRARWQRGDAQSGAGASAGSARRDRQSSAAATRDGYRNLSGRCAREPGRSPLPFELGASGFALTGPKRVRRLRSRSPSAMPIRSTAAATGSRAGRIWAEFGDARVGVERPSVGLAPRLAQPQLPRRRRDQPHTGKRATLGAQVEHRFDTGAIEHQLIVAARPRARGLRARDIDSGGSTNQDRDRQHQRADGRMAREMPGRWSADVAVRRDAFNRFKDATTLRASLLADIGSGFSRRRLLWRRHRPADLLRPLRLLSRNLRWQSVA